MAEALQVSVAPVMTEPLEFGEIETLPTVGVLFSTVIVVEVLLTVIPSLSVAVAVHAIVFPGDTNDELSCHDEPTPELPFEALQVYETFKEPSFKSVAVALHVKTVELFTPLLGEMLGVVTVGWVF